jgi:hypothetical protein
MHFNFLVRRVFSHLSTYLCFYFQFVSFSLFLCMSLYFNCLGVPQFCSRGSQGEGGICSYFAFASLTLVQENKYIYNWRTNSRVFVQVLQIAKIRIRMNTFLSLVVMFCLLAKIFTRKTILSPNVLKRRRLCSGN